MTWTRRASLLCLTLLCIGFVACGGGHRGGGGGGDDDDGPGDDDDVPSTPCEAEFEIAMSDGSTATNDYCVSSSLQATYEFDPDDPPEVREPEMLFEATTEQDFDCWVRIDEPQVCGPGYYRMDGSSGTVEFNTFDCSGVGDDYEGLFTASSGYVHIIALSAGDTPGNFSGEEIETSLTGSLSVQSSGGPGLSGNFHIRAPVLGGDAEEAGCSVSDGDEDDDGFIDEYFGGEDCDDSNGAINPGEDEVCDELDNDCDGVVDNVPAPDNCISGTWEGTYSEVADFILPIEGSGPATATVTGGQGGSMVGASSATDGLFGGLIDIAFEGGLDDLGAVTLAVSRTSGGEGRDVTSFEMEGSFDLATDSFSATGTFTSSLEGFGEDIPYESTLQLSRVGP